MQSSETVLRLNQAQCWFVGYKEAKKKKKEKKKEDKNQCQF